MVTPVNLWMQSLFNQVDVYFQQKLVSSSGTNYAYKAYMDVLLNFSEDAETSQMQTQLFYKDSAGAFDQTKINEIPLNQGLILRQKLAKNSQLVDMCGPICADTFNMSRYLLNEVDMRLIAKKSSACEGQNCERGWQQSGRGRCGYTCEFVDAKFV